MTTLNNTRDFEVNIREKSINVLLYGNMLDWNFAMLKREFAEDATIKLTSVYRKNAEVVLIDGARQDGDTALILASVKGHLTVVDSLIEKGAKVDHADKVSARG